MRCLRTALAAVAAPAVAKLFDTCNPDAIVGDCVEAPSIRKMDGAERTVVRCPDGQKVVSGGCYAKSPPWFFSYSAPSGDEGWECGGSSASNTAWAICLPKFSPTIIAVEGSDFATVWCDEGQRIIGGGCNATDPPHTFKYSGPVGDNGWMCGGFGGTKRVSAICSSKLAPMINEVTGSTWTSAACGRGEKILGGGCFASDPPHPITYSAPHGDAGWICGGFQGARKVWAICTTPVGCPANHSYCDGSRCLCKEGSCSFDGRTCAATPTPRPAPTTVPPPRPAPVPAPLPNSTGNARQCLAHAVVGTCLKWGCFLGHGKVHCGGRRLLGIPTQCICDHNHCSSDGWHCVPDEQKGGSGGAVRGASELATTELALAADAVFWGVLGFMSVMTCIVVVKRASCERWRPCRGAGLQDGLLSRYAVM